MDILISLIEHYGIIEKINFGLEKKIVDNFKEKYKSYEDEDLNQILSARYINKILTLVYY